MLLWSKYLSQLVRRNHRWQGTGVTQTWLVKNTRYCTDAQHGNQFSDSNYKLTSEIQQRKHEKRPAYFLTVTVALQERIEDQTERDIQDSFKKAYKSRF